MKETPTNKGEEDSVATALKSEIDTVKEQFRQQKFELDRKEVFLEAGITSDEDKAKFEKITDLDTLRELTKEFQEMRSLVQDKEKKEEKQITSGPKVPDFGKDKTHKNSTEWFLDTLKKG